MEAQTPPVQVYHEALPQRKAGINGLAIASFVCSLCWGYGLLSIVSIVFALVARSQIRKNAEIGRDQPGNGFAIAGLVIGIVGLVITAIIILIALAAAGSASSTTTTTY